MFVSKSEREVCIVSAWDMVPCSSCSMHADSIKAHVALAQTVLTDLQTIAERERLFKEAEEEKEREKQRREVRAVSCHCKHMYHLRCMLPVH